MGELERNKVHGQASTKHAIHCTNFSNNDGLFLKFLHYILVESKKGLAHNKINVQIKHPSVSASANPYVRSSCVGWHSSKPINVLCGENHRCSFLIII